MVVVLIAPVNPVDSVVGAADQHTAFGYDGHLRAGRG